MESLVRNSCIALVCAIWGSCSKDLKKALSDILWFSRHNIASCIHQLFAVYAGQFNRVLTADFGLGTGLDAPSVLGRGEDLPIDADDRLRRWSRTVRFLIDSLSPPDSPVGGCIVDTEDCEDASESAAPSVMRPRRLEAAVSDLFFLGTGGSTFPGSSIRNCLCSRVKSP